VGKRSKDGGRQEADRQAGRKDASKGETLNTPKDKLARFRRENNKLDGGGGGGGGGGGSTSSTRGSLLWNPLQS
jgi:hypothetical protein